MSSNNNVLVFGPDIQNKVSGNGWVKYNIIKAFLKRGYKVTSVYNAESDEPIREGTSSEERGNEHVSFLHVGVGKQPKSWESIIEMLQPTHVVTVGDWDKSWFVPLSPLLKTAKKVYYYINESRMVNRYIYGGVNKEGKRRFLDLNLIMTAYDMIIPATPLTKKALSDDAGFKFKADVEPITPPVWKWDISKEKSLEYRDSINVGHDSKLHFCIAFNSPRKRLDQVLLYYRSRLLKRPCCKLVIHTGLKVDGYDIISIASRLGITSNVLVNERTSHKAMEGVFSAGDVFISLPAAEGYGLPFHEALLLDKECIHSDVGYISEEMDLLKGSKVDIVDARHPYFLAGTNEAWYSIGSNPKVRRKGKSGSYTINELINTPEQFQNKIAETIDI